MPTQYGQAMMTHCRALGSKGEGRPELVEQPTCRSTDRIAAPNHTVGLEHDWIIHVEIRHCERALIWISFVEYPFQIGA